MSWIAMRMRMWMKLGLAEKRNLELVMAMETDLTLVMAMRWQTQMAIETWMRTELQMKVCLLYVAGMKSWCRMKTAMVVELLLVLWTETGKEIERGMEMQFCLL